jgi:HK97 family phage portal protein
VAGVLDFFRMQPSPVPLRDAPAPAKALSDVTVPYERDWTVNWPWQDGAGDVSLVGGYTASYAAMYRRQPWIHIAVNKLSRGIGRLPLKVYSGEERERDKSSPLARLLMRPYPGGTPFGLKSAIVGDLAVYGNAIVIKQGGGRDRPPVALYPVCPRGWAVDERGEYVWRHPQTSAEKRYRPDQVIHFRHWRPGDDALGLSPLEPLRMTLAIEDAAQRLAVANFGNGARPSGVLRTDQDISKEKLAELRTGIARMYKGVDKSGLPAILTNGLDWKSMSWDMQQAAVVEFRKLTREEVAAVYDIPPVLLGILDRATFSNVEELHLAFYQDTLGPWTTLIEETLYEQLIAPVPEFADAERFAEFDMNEVLKGAIAQRYDALNKAAGGPWMTVNEARRVENLPQADQGEADLVRFPLNMSSEPSAEEGGTPDARA